MNTETLAQNPLGTRPIGRLIAKFAVPAVIGMLVNAIYNLVDQIFIGQGIGLLGIAATNVSFPLTTVCTAVALLLAVGGATNFNLRIGEGKPEEASRVAGNMVSFGLIFGVALGALTLIFVEPLMRAFGSTEAVLPMAIEYTAIIAPGIPFLLFATVCSNLIRADGSPTYSMACMLAGAIFNMIFDPIFLFVFDMGIAGIALATTLGQVLSGLMSVFYLVKRFKSVPLKRRHLRPQLRTLARISALGASASFNQLAMTVVQVTMNNTLRHYGALSAYGSDIPLAAVGAISKVNVLFVAVVVGIGQGCQPIWGFNYGAKNYARVKRTLYLALTINAIIGIAAFLVFQGFPSQIMAIFGENDPLYLQFSVRYFQIFMFMTFTNGVQPTTASFFNSIGKAYRGIFISLTRQLIFLLPLILILPRFLGIDGLMYAGPIADAAAFATCLFLLITEVRRINRQQQALTTQTEAANGTA